MAEEMDMESLEGMKKLEEMLMNAAEPGQMPSRKQIMEILENSELSDELKENMKMLLNAGAPQLFGSTSGGTYLGIVFVFIIFMILIFFGYKLYKSIKEKEIKREEKKKQKQMKKKK